MYRTPQLIDIDLLVEALIPTLQIKDTSATTTTTKQYIQISSFSLECNILPKGKHLSLEKQKYFIDIDEGKNVSFGFIFDKKSNILLGLSINTSKNNFSSEIGSNTIVQENPFFYSLFLLFILVRYHHHHHHHFHDKQQTQVFAPNQSSISSPFLMVIMSDSNVTTAGKTCWYNVQPLTVPVEAVQENNASPFVISWQVYDFRTTLPLPVDDDDEHDDSVQVSKMKSLLTFKDRDTTAGNSNVVHCKMKKNFVMNTFPFQTTINDLTPLLSYFFTEKARDAIARQTNKSSTTKAQPTLRNAVLQTEAWNNYHQLGFISKHSSEIEQSQSFLQKQVHNNTRVLENPPQQSFSSQEKKESITLSNEEQNNAQQIQNPSKNSVSLMYQSQFVTPSQPEIAPIPSAMERNQSKTYFHDSVKQKKQIKEMQDEINRLQQLLSLSNSKKHQKGFNSSPLPNATNITNTNTTSQHNLGENSNLYEKELFISPISDHSSTSYFRISSSSVESKTRSSNIKYNVMESKFADNDENVQDVRNDFSEDDDDDDDIVQQLEKKYMI